MRLTCHYVTTASDTQTHRASVIQCHRIIIIISRSSGSTSHPNTYTHQHTNMGLAASKQSEESSQVGYRVLGVQPDSPAARGGLVSFFDFIVGANGVPLDKLDSTFIDVIQDYEEKILTLQVYNWKCKSTRTVELIPSKKWSGEGLLGVTIRFDTYHDAEEHICHVLDVESNSPAELAGLQADTDYLLGTVEKAFSDVDILRDELEKHYNQVVEFYVYNSVTDQVRIVVLMPNNDWSSTGSGGLLGANVAQGYLHVLPSSCCYTIGSSMLETMGSSATIITSDMSADIETATTKNDQ